MSAPVIENLYDYMILDTINKYRSQTLLDCIVIEIPILFILPASIDRSFV